MATNNAVDTSLSGQTGTGSFVGSTSPVLVTPSLGVATATSLAFSPTTGGLIGTNTNNNASSGIVGEFISSVIASGSALSLTASTPANLTTISLTAGDWDVWGNLHFTPSIGMSNVFGWASTTSVTLPDTSLYNSLGTTTNIITDMGLSIPQLRFSLTTTTTIFLTAQSDFASGTCVVSGGIYARRAR